MKKTIYMLTAIVALPLGAVAQNGALESNPANDRYTRIHNFYSAAVATTDRRTSEQYYGRCIPLIEDFLRVYPSHKNAQAVTYYLGEANFKIGEMDRANVVYKKVVDKYKKGPFVAASAYRLARNKYSESKFEEAAVYFGLTANNAKDKADRNKSMYFQAQCLTRAGKFKEAMPVYGSVAAANGHNPYREPAAMTYAKLLLQDEQYDKALQICESLLVPSQDEDTKAEAAYYAGVATSNLKDEKKALRFFRMSLNSNSQKLKGRAQTGVMGILYANKDYEGVLKETNSGRYPMIPKYKAKQGLMVGNCYFMKKKYASAISYLIDVETNDKGSEIAFEAGYKKLLCYYNIKNDQIADKVDRFLANYAVGRGKHRFIHQAILMKAESLFAQQSYKESAKAYTAINSNLIDEKYLQELMFKRGYSLAKVENHAGAANAFTAYVDKYPESKNVNDAYLLRASAYVSLDDKGRALRDYDHVIKTAPKTKNAAIALQRSAKIQMIKEKYEDMAKRCETLLKNFPDLTPKTKAYTHFLAGRGQFKAKKYEEGLEHFDKSLKLDATAFPQQIGMYRVVGYFTLRDVKGTTKALEQAEEAGIRKKIPLNVYRWLGGEYYNIEEFKKSSEYLRKGVERGKPEATPLSIWRILSKAQLKAELYQDAYLTLTILLDLEEDKPKKVDALLDKAKVESALGKTGDSKATAEAALEMNPTGRTQAELLKVVGDFYYLIGETKEAANRYVLLVDDAEDLEFHPQVLDRLSRCLEKLGDASESSKYLNQLKKGYPRYKREKLD